MAAVPGLKLVNKRQICRQFRHQNASNFKLQTICRNEGITLMFPVFWFKMYYKSLLKKDLYLFDKLQEISAAKVDHFWAPKILVQAVNSRSNNNLTNLFFLIEFPSLHLNYLLMTCSMWHATLDWIQKLIALNMSTLKALRFGIPLKYQTI